MVGKGQGQLMTIWSCRSRLGVSLGLGMNELGPGRTDRRFRERASVLPLLPFGVFRNEFWIQLLVPRAPFF